MDVDENFVEVCGCRVLLRRAGTGRPVLFLHGAGGVPQWVPFFDRLAERFRLIVPDHPSFGRSETPEWLDEMGDLGFFYCCSARNCAPPVSSHFNSLSRRSAPNPCADQQVELREPRSGRHPSATERPWGR